MLEAIYVIECDLWQQLDLTAAGMLFRDFIHVSSKNKNKSR